MTVEIEDKRIEIISLVHETVDKMQKIEELQILLEVSNLSVFKQYNKIVKISVHKRFLIL